MSDSKSSNSLPSDSAFEKILRDTATEFYNTDPHNLTLKRVRQAVERKLRLEDGFLKADDKWNAKSKDIITDQAQRLDNGEQQTYTPIRPESSKSVAEVNAAGSAVKKGNKSGPAKHGTKRSNNDVKLKSRKKRKVEKLESEEEKDVEPTLNDSPERDACNDSEEEQSTKQKAKRKDNTKQRKIATNRSMAKKIQKADLNSDQESTVGGQDEKPPAVKAELDEPEEANMSPETTRAPERSKDELSESELSSLIDEPPPPKKKRPRKSSSPKPSKPSNPKSKPTKSVSAEPSSDPQTEEIKRLQDWLTKCGIRKVWGKELALYSTPREKIAHLKEMLKEAGMDGRYSIQKARQIKEARELAADLEAVKDFDRHWGKNEDEEQGRRPRGAAKLLMDFSDDGEESD
jgi:hypothetical protein